PIHSRVIGDRDWRARLRTIRGDGQDVTLRPALLVHAPEDDAAAVWRPSRADPVRLRDESFLAVADADDPDAAESRPAHRIEPALVGTRERGAVRRPVRIEAKVGDPPDGFPGRFHHEYAAAVPLRPECDAVSVGRERGGVVGLLRVRGQEGGVTPPDAKRIQ